MKFNTYLIIINKSFQDDLIILHSDMLFNLKQKRADVGLALLKHLPRLSNLVK